MQSAMPAQCGCNAHAAGHPAPHRPMLFTYRNRFLEKSSHLQACAGQPFVSRACECRSLLKQMHVHFEGVGMDLKGWPGLYRGFFMTYSTYSP